MSDAMVHWLPFSWKKTCPAPYNYHILDAAPPLKMDIKREPINLAGLKSNNPLSDPDVLGSKYNAVPKIYQDTYFYGWNKGGVRPYPQSLTLPKNGRTQAEVDDLDYSNYYNCRK